MKRIMEQECSEFGHTFGHAIEKYYDYSRYSHGEAVALEWYI